MLTKSLIKKNRFILIGAGALGRSIYFKLKTLGYKPLFIADSNLSQDVLFDDDIYIRNYSYLRNFNNKEIVVIVTVFNPKASFKLIKKQLKDFGFTNICSFIELFKFFAGDFLPFLNYDTKSRYSTELKFIQHFVDKLSDNKSIEIFKTNLVARKSFNMDLYPKSDGEFYFPQELFKNKLFDNCLYVDCGAYDGDTVIQFIKDHPTSGRVIAFEPDSTNFQKMLWNINSLKSSARNKILSFQAGVSNKNSLAKFQGDMGMGSKIGLSGKSIAQLIKVDDIIHTERYNQIFVKLDVEGNELNALMGMRRLIAEKCPSLAISVYHKFDDIWKIGNYINTLNKNYSFYLRQHGNDGMDLILYCKQNL